MTSQTKIIKELKPGKSWFVCWEVQGELFETNATNCLQKRSNRSSFDRDIDSRVFRKLLRFLYTGSSGFSKQDPSDVLQALFLAADKYQVDALREICEECLMLKLAIQNVLHLLAWAHQYGASKLKETAMTHIVHNRKEVWKLKGWADFNKKYPDLFYLACDRMVQK